MDELEHYGLGTLLQIQVYDDFLKCLGLCWILVILDDMVLDHFVW